MSSKRDPQPIGLLYSRHDNTTSNLFFVLDLFKGVIFSARAAIELHATSRARQAYAPSYEADAV